MKSLRGPFGTGTVVNRVMGCLLCLVGLVLMFRFFGVSGLGDNDWFGLRQTFVNLGSMMVFEIGMYWVESRADFPFREAFRSLIIALPGTIAWAIEFDIAQVLFSWAGRHQLFHIPSNTLFAYACIFLIFEFHYYWVHRLMHRTAWMWADHQVHHTSTLLSYVDSNRLGGTVFLTGGFYMAMFPWVFLGFDPSRMVNFVAVVLIYTSVFHLRLFPRLGLLDKIINSPSNHRVHHASNPRHLDSNYGGTTMIFDQFFGTYSSEADEPDLVYGLIGRDTANESLLKILYTGWGSVLANLRASRSVKDVVKSIFYLPGWTVDGTGKTTDQIKAEFLRPEEKRAA